MDDGTGWGPVEGGEKRGLALARALGLQMMLLVTMASAPRTGLRQDLPSHWTQWHGALGTLMKRS